MLGCNDERLMLHTSGLYHVILTWFSKHRAWVVLPPCQAAISQQNTIMHLPTSPGISRVPHEIGAAASSAAAATWLIASRLLSCTNMLEIYTLYVNHHGIGSFSLHLMHVSMSCFLKMHVPGIPSDVQAQRPLFTTCWVGLVRAYATCGVWWEKPLIYDCRRDTFLFDAL